MPETSNAILAAKRRARDYWDIDGLPALLAGAATIMVGVISLPPGSHRSWPGMAFVLWIGAWLFLLNDEGTLKWLKSRITYPRTGYVAPSKVPYEHDPYTIISITKEPEGEGLLASVEGRASRKALKFSDSPFLLLLVLWWLFSFNGWLASLACLAIALWFWWRNKKDPPWFEIAGAAIAALLSAILTVSDRSRFCIVLIVFGASGMTKGATLLIRYLRRHPAAQA